MSKQSNYLSLFNGISAGRLALDKIGKTFDNYFISEIDSHANKVSESNYPDNQQLGDILQWREWDIVWSSIDLITAGFPCQSWSVAGHQLGDKDERGMLFWVMLDIMKHAKENNPDVKFMIENVKMKMEFEEYITHHTEAALGDVHKTLINSALVSAQNRNRYYWTNFEVSQPEDHGIVLQDILEDDCITDRAKSYCVDANYHKGGNPDQYFNKSRRQLVFRATVQSHAEHTYDGKLPTLTAAMGVGGGNVPMGTTKELSEVFKGMYLNADDRTLYRKLSVVECARAQTFPDDWCEGVSKTRAYKCLGNAWTVDVISHILRCCYESGN